MQNRENNKQIRRKMTSSTEASNIEQLKDARPQQARVYAIGANVNHGLRLFCISPNKEFF